MARTTVGQSLTIDPRVIEDLGRAEEKMRALASATQEFVDKTGSAFVTLVNKMSSEAAGMANRVESEFGRIPSSFRRMVDEMRSDARSFGETGSSMGSSLVDGLKQALDGASGSLMDSMAKVASGGTESMTQFTQKVESMLTALQSGMSTIGTKVGEDIPKAIADLQQKMEASSKSLEGLGRKMGDAIARGMNESLRGGLGAVIDRLQQLAQAESAVSSAGQNMTQILTLDGAKIDMLSSSVITLNHKLGELNESMTKTLEKRDPGTRGAADALRAITMASTDAKNSLFLQREAQKDVLQGLLRDSSAAEAKVSALAGRITYLQGLLSHFNDNSTGSMLPSLVQGLAEAEAELSKWQQAWSSLQNKIAETREAIDRLKNEAKQPMPDGALENFEKSLRKMSRADLESMVRGLERMRDELSKTKTGDLSPQFKTISEYLAAANKELARTKALIREATGAGYDWQGNVKAMVDRAASPQAITQLKEMKALQQALYREIEKAENSMSKASKPMVEAYRAVSKQVSATEEAIRGVGRAAGESGNAAQATGAERSFRDITRSAEAASASLKSVNADFSDMRARIESLPLQSLHNINLSALDATMKTVSDKAVQLGQAMSRINEEAARYADQMAYASRLSSQAPSAAMGRMDQIGLDGFRKSIEDSDATLERLKTDLSDVQAVMERTVRTGSDGSLTRDWKELVELAELARQKISAYEEAKNKPATPQTAMDLVALANTAKTYDELRQAIDRLKAEKHKLDPDKDADKLSMLNNALANAENRLGAVAVKLGDIKSVTQSSPVDRASALVTASVDSVVKAREAVQEKRARDVGDYEAKIAQMKDAESKEVEELGRLEEALKKVERARASMRAAGYGEGTKPDKEYQKEIDAIQSQMNALSQDRPEAKKRSGLISYYTAGIKKLTDEINNAQAGIDRLKTAMASGSPTEGIDEFKKRLEKMSRDDLQDVIRGLQQMQSSMDRAPDGKLTREYKNVGEYLRAATAELERFSALDDAVKQKKYSWEGSKAGMESRAQSGDLVQLQEMHALQQALWNEIQKIGDATSAEAKKMGDAYQKVTEKIKQTEDALRGVGTQSQKAAPKTKGWERGFAAIRDSAKSAETSVKSLNADLSDMRARLQNLSVDQMANGLPTSSMRYMSEAMQAAVDKMEKFREVSASVNEALQPMADKLAYFNREAQQPQGNAALGRLSVEGIDGLRKSIEDTSTTAERLKRDMADVEALLARTAKYNSSGITNEWRELEGLLLLVRKRLEDYTVAKDKASRLRRDGDAVDLARKAVTYEQLRDAVTRLKNEMYKLDPAKDAAMWQTLEAVLKDTQKRFDELRKKMGELKESAKGAGSEFSELKSLIAQVFTIQGVFGFLKKMVEVHAQLHLQGIALRAILQDKSKADEVFAQVQSMAMQSPFTIMQLTTYAKQLAAYRIESEKLVDTTKRLADVSAGLGVDMGRLILAYGQIKAANYLRATEVRQLTEAGLNIYGELSKYFTEMKGRAVSVADVMNMVYKRLVKFTDVEAVFQRITSKGGMFFDMQKKQADSVHGMMQRIQDAYTIMMDQIGTSNEGVIKWALTTIRELIQSWRTFAPIIKTAASAVMAFYAVKGVAAMIRGVETLCLNFKSLISGIRGATAATRELAAAQAATKWASLAAIVAALGMLIYEAATHVDALTEKLGEMRDEAIASTNDAVSNFRGLCNILGDVNSTYSQQKEALEEINRTYAKIFSNHALTAKEVMKIADNWEAAEKQMRAYYAAVLEEDQRKQAQNTEEAALNKAVDSVVKQDFLKELVPNYSVQRGRSIMDGVVADIKDGTLEASDALEEFLRRLEEFYQLEGIATEKNAEKLAQNTKSLARRLWDAYSSLLSLGTSSLSESMQEPFGWLGGDAGKSIQTALDRSAKALSEIGTAEVGVANVQQEALKSKLEDNDKSLKKAQDLLGDLHTMKLEGELEIGDDGKFTDDAANQLVEELKSNLKDAGVSTLDIAAGDLLVMADNFLSVEDAVKAWGEESDAAFDLMYAGLTLTARGLGLMDKETESWLERVRQARYEARNMFDISAQIKEILKNVADKDGVSYDLFAQVDTNSVTNAVKELKGKYEEVKEVLEAIEAVSKSIADEEQKRLAEELWASGKTKEELQEELQALEDMVHALGGALNGEKKKGGKDIWETRLDLLKKYNSEYEKLLKHYDAQTARQKIVNSLAEANAEAFKGTRWENISVFGGFDKDDIARAMEEMLSNVNTDSMKRKWLEAIGVFDLEVDIKVQDEFLKAGKEEIERMFNDWEIVKEFNELGISLDFFPKLGNRRFDSLHDFMDAVDAELEEWGQTTSLGEAWEDYMRETRRKLREMDARDEREQAKNSIKYLKQSMGERGRILMEAIQEENRIMRSGSMDGDTKKMAVEQLKKKMGEDLAKQDWKDFKGTDMYIRIFESLESAGTASLLRLKEGIEQVKSSMKGLAPEQMRAMTKEIEKLDAELRGRDPFGSLRKSLEAVNATRKEGFTLETWQTMAANSSDRVSAYQQELNDLDTKIGLLTQAQDIDVVDARTKARIVQYEGMSVEQLQAQKKNVEGKLKAEQGALNTANQNLALYSKLNKDIEASLQLWNKIYDAANKAKKAVTSMLEAAGVDVDTMGAAFAQAGLELVNMAVQTYMFSLQMKLLGAEVKSAMGPIGYALIAIEAIASVFTLLSGAGDKKKQRRIDEIKESVDGLSRAYDRLKTSIDQAFKFDEFWLSARKANENTKEQIRSYQQMIALEQSKKKTDESKIKEYRQAIEDLEQQMRDLSNETTKAMGGIGRDGRLDAATSFVEAWLDAFKETGDGLDALEDKWDEYIDNLMMKQAAYRIVGKRMEAFFDKVDDMANSGTKASMKEVLDKIMEMEGDVLGKANEELKEFFDYFGWRGTSNLLLSDLQKGIQTITEPQAAALESIANSMRFALFQQLDSMQALLQSVRAQYESGTSPMLAEVRELRRLVSSIDSNLRSVVRTSGSPDGRPYVRVS